MKVYLATKSRYADYGVVGVFTTEEKARKAAIAGQDEGYGPNEPEEFELDPEVKVKLTIIQAFKNLNEILTSYRDGGVTSDQAAKEIQVLTEQAKSSGLDFNVSISAADLNSTSIGYESSSSSSY